MEYKVCILAAGKNTRVSYAKDINVALLPVGTKSALSRILDKFPRNVEIVTALGYNRKLIRDFVGMAYSERKITFVEVNNWDKPGSGPGYSLLQCKPYLQCPFIQVAADTLVAEDIPEPSENWFGVAEVDSTERFLSVALKDNKVVRHGINGFGESGTPSDLYRKYKLDPEGIASVVRNNYVNYN